MGKVTLEIPGFREPISVESQYIDEDGFKGKDASTSVEGINISLEDFFVSKIIFLNPNQYNTFSNEGWFSGEVKEIGLKGYSTRDLAIKETLKEFGTKISANIRSVQSKKSLNLLKASDKKDADIWLDDLNASSQYGITFSNMPYNGNIICVNTYSVTRRSNEKMPNTSRFMFAVGNISVLYRHNNGKIDAVTVLRAKVFKKPKSSGS